MLMRRRAPRMTTATRRRQPRAGAPGRAVGAPVGGATLTAPGAADSTSNAAADAQTDELVFEEARFEYVPWNRLRVAVAETWAQVDWLAFEHELTRQELVDRFGATIGNEVELNVSYADTEKDQKPAHP